jgi:hypothetical protein
MVGGIIVVVVGALLCWSATDIRNWGRQRLDQRKIYEWLKSNTRDYPGESHVELLKICKGARLPEERAREACMSDERIHLFGKEPQLWSVWREEPQSIYEKRGILRLGD